KKAHHIKFLTEELPTIEHMKKRRFDLYDNWKCPMCKYCTESFDHVFICTKSKNKVAHVILNSKKLIVDLMYQHANVKVPLTTLTNISNIWNLQKITSELSFIDLIKGIVPLALVNKINEFVKNK